MADRNVWRGPFELFFFEGRPRGRVEQLLASSPRYGTPRAEIGPLVFGKRCPRCGRVFRKGEARVGFFQVTHYNVDDNGFHGIDYAVPYVNGNRLDGRQVVMFE